MMMSVTDLTENPAIDREKVDQYIEELRHVGWKQEAKVVMLVETPQPHRHAQRDRVEVVKGKGFAGDHARKSFFRGEYIPGREVSAISVEVLDVLGVDPIVVGDNLITQGVDLGALQAGDLLHIGDAVLKRSDKPHRPCRTFRARTTPEAFAVVSRSGYRGALFIVDRSGAVRKGEAIRIERAEQDSA